ncbi:hypothetical protein KEM63_14020 [Halopseudomonas nanhaiensis]|uniref:hypothetical protein n=1 Tax=Halopseudomonas nanhaiensis TaxID=2830842 RepID=UPI001CBB0EF9|nr:hypothetical protein [Halopseudomonas nanhaiensis]UAW97900.1 hypothetical protein KEM63_14020 [Halopseudomonas nanhaiensis]
MGIRAGALLGALLVALASPAMAEQVRLPHDEFLPPDVYGSRQDRPDHVLFQVTAYRLTLGSETIPQAIPGVQGSSAWLFLDGHSLVDGNPIDRAQVNLIEAGGRMLPARLDRSSNTLMLFMPAAQLDTLLTLFASPGPHYVQARFYANGTVWSDIHSGPVKLGIE